ncbi:hypothetical protein HJG60_008459 [Phyllostomus discolor]|uniref:Uncharacterized protein n=1 Tax=Phyllostomus discolor TaxID=89673 RepID=A0A833Z511_9CHIR|nr:hypothetical protein HJG60_008459 [Phyllostomus discolor]
MALSALAYYLGSLGYQGSAVCTVEWVPFLRTAVTKRQGLTIFLPPSLPSFLPSCLPSFLPSSLPPCLPSFLPQFLLHLFSSCFSFLLSPHSLSACTRSRCELRAGSAGMMSKVGLIWDVPVASTDKAFTEEGNSGLALEREGKGREGSRNM